MERSLSLLPDPIGFLLIPKFTVIGLSSAIEPARIANRYVGTKYRWLLISVDGRPVPDGNGISVNVDSSISGAPRLGTLIICADLEPDKYATPQLLGWLRRLGRTGTHLGGLDTGPEILARAGLLEGYRATVHWEVIPSFKERFPDIDVTSRLFEFDRDRITCAGGTAAIDMMLHAIERHHGRDVAVRVSEHCIHERIREPSDAQRIDLASRYSVYNPKLLGVLQLMEDNVEQPLRLKKICESVGISVRQALRLFDVHLQKSPRQFYLHLRLERSRRLLIRTDMPVSEVAVACGFQSQSHFSRAYRKEFGHPPRFDRRAPQQRELTIMDRPQARP